MLNVMVVKNTLEETRKVLQHCGYAGMPMTLISDWLDEFYADYKALGGTKIKYENGNNEGGEHAG